jgi:crotonobetainyl-CoA:carnitine CoA-transferase CaiB-like acyl-CoA transferase
MSGGESELLAGLSVSQVGGTPAAAAAGALFRLLGASVTVYANARPGGGLRRIQERALLEELQRGNEVRHADDPLGPETLSRAAGADVTVADISAAPRAAGDELVPRYLDAVGRLNSSAWVTISAYGLDGNRREYRGTELTALASGGIAHYIRSGTGRPMKPAGYTASIAAGHIAVLAGLHGLIARRDRGRPVHLDLSLQDSVVSTGVFLECAHVLFRSPGKSGMGRYAAPRGYFPSRDGHVFIVILEDHQWAGVVKGMGDPAWARGIVTNADRLANSEMIESEIRAWAATRTANECADLLQAHGAPAAPLNSCADLLADPDFRDGGFLQPTGPNGQVVPGLPALLTRFGPTGSSELELDGPPVAGRTRVLDLGNVLAGPLGTSWLGTMGLDVLKVEDPARLDIYRRRGPFIEGGDDIEHGAYFAAANYSKRSCSVALESDVGRSELGKLVHESDFVVENLSASRAARLGLTAAAASASETTLVSSSGFGRRSVKANYRAYGQIIHSYGGITYLTRDADHNFRALGTSWADPLTAAWIGVLTLGQVLRPASQRRHVDLSMVKVVARQIPEYFAAAASGQSFESTENSLPGYAPHGIYRCAGDDSWLALAVSDDDEWSSLVQVLAHARLRDGSLRTAAARQDAGAALDKLMDEVLRERDADEVFERLQHAGVPCSPVMSAARLAMDAHLHQRGLIQTVHHAVWGEREVTGLPWKVVGEGPLTVRPTPLLGSATGY